MSMKTVSYTNFIKEHLTILSVETKEIKNQEGQGGKGTYNIAKFQYNYGTRDKPINDDFYLELCELDSSRGIIRSKVPGGKNDKEEESIMVTFDVSNDEVKRCFDVMNIVHQRMIELVMQNKEKLAPRCEVDDPNIEKAIINNSYKSKVTYPVDKTTKKRLEGRNPVCFLKLFSWGSGPSAFQTKFVSLDENYKPFPVPRQKLLNAKIKLIPLLHFTRIFAGSKFSFQCQLHSAIVTGWVPLSDALPQTETLEMLKNNTETMERLREQMSLLMKSDDKESIVTTLGDSSTETSTSTFASIPKLDI